MASTTNVPQTVRNDGDAIRAGTYDPQPPTWEQEGKSSTPSRPQVILLCLISVYSRSISALFSFSLKLPG